MDVLTPHSTDSGLINDLRDLINEARRHVAVTVNSAISILYWHIGHRINNEILKGERAEYGKRIIASISKQLTAEFGKGYDEKSLRHMMRFASIFPDIQIVSTVSRQLSWSHFKEVMATDDRIKREFYLTMAADQHWSVRTLRTRIDSMLYERTAIASKPDNVIIQELAELRNDKKMSPDLTFHDPYFLDFLGLDNTYSEKDFESAIVSELQQFITELGNDFAFMTRQKRITVDAEDYYIDLLFYHRRLRCLVAIELKLGRFKAAYKGQMELYLRWLEQNEMVEGENKPIGLILCAGKSEEHIELMHLNESNIRVADYLTKLPDAKLLESKLKLAIDRARQQFEAPERHL